MSAGVASQARRQTARQSELPATSTPGTRSWFQRHRYLLLRRLVQACVLGLFLVGPLAGLWWVKGNLSSSLTLDLLPLTDPLLILQILAAGHVPEATALIGATIVGLFYALLGGRLFCSWVCPINPVTDLAHWLHVRMGLPPGWQPRRHTRWWLLGTVLLLSAITGTLVWELVNPVSMLHRGLIFGIGTAWSFVVGVFLFDTFVSRRGWCSRLCPMGSLYSLLNHKSLLRVSATNRAACDNCMDCFQVCPEKQVITPALRGEGSATPLILSRDCTDCGRCIDVCEQKVFRFTHRFNHRIDSNRYSDQHCHLTTSTSS